MPYNKHLHLILLLELSIQQQFKTDFLAFPVFVDNFVLQKLLELKLG
ncbi:19254_t:CDS:2 [Dentiscutata erythropus]|uniref:19254_t:CDS:1 n=1 Tax=Dentiscutata erythropus TaxID=1348616 RepID=A0A9N8ZT90_9GLOM|nr:19254_t:CDS:2 [Dentiscutata erythropus]